MNKLTATNIIKNSRSGYANEYLHTILLHEISLTVAETGFPVE